MLPKIDLMQAHRMPAYAEWQAWRAWRASDEGAGATREQCWQNLIEDGLAARA